MILRPMSLRPAERRLAMGAAVVIGCWAMVSWVLQPLWDRAADARRYADTQTQRLEAVGRLLAQSPEVERGYASVAGYLQPGDHAQAQSTLLNLLEATAQASNVQLGLTPRPAKHQDRVSRFDIELDVEGSQQSVLAFLDAILRMPRLVAVERLRMTGVPLKPDLVRATIVLQHLAFSGV